MRVLHVHLYFLTGLDIFLNCPPKLTYIFEEIHPTLRLRNMLFWIKLLHIKEKESQNTLKTPFISRYKAIEKAQTKKKIINWIKLFPDMILLVSNLYKAIIVRYKWCMLYWQALLLMSKKCNIIQQHHRILILLYVCAHYNNDDKSHTNH